MYGFVSVPADVCTGKDMLRVNGEEYDTTTVKTVNIEGITLLRVCLGKEKKEDLLHSEIELLQSRKADEGNEGESFVPAEDTLYKVKLYGKDLRLGKHRGLFRIDWITDEHGEELPAEYPLPIGDFLLDYGSLKAKFSPTASLFKLPYDYIPLKGIHTVQVTVIPLLGEELTEELIEGRDGVEEFTTPLQERETSHPLCAL